MPLNNRCRTCDREDCGMIGVLVPGRIRTWRTDPEIEGKEMDCIAHAVDWQGRVMAAEFKAAHFEVDYADALRRVNELLFKIKETDEELRSTGDKLLELHRYTSDIETAAIDHIVSHDADPMQDVEQNETLEELKRVIDRARTK